jgi:rhodanese-related sulfurtransferase
MLPNFIKKVIKLPLMLLLIALLVASCSDKTTNPPVQTEADILASYLESVVEVSPYLNTLPNYMTATDVRTAVQSDDPAWTVIDLRSPSLFSEGHIKSAINVIFSNLLSYYNGNGLKSKKRVVLVCETGQTSGYAVTLLRITGATNVYSLKYGMSSWNTKCDVWTANCSSAYESNFVTSTDLKPTSTYTLPSITTGKTTGSEIALARVNDLLSKGFEEATISAKTVFDNLSNYFIISYWPNTYYLDPGHIPGSFNFQPKTADNPASDLMLSTYLKLLPTTKTIVVYDYTGQISAYVVAYLRAMGYDARSINFGGNGMIYNKMKSKVMTIWSQTECKQYELTM